MSCGYYVGMKDLGIIKLSELKHKGVNNSLMFTIGKDYSNNVVKVDFKEFPHLLIAGSTGSGKSTLIHTIIANAIENNIVTYISDPKMEYKKYTDSVDGIYDSYESTLESLSLIKGTMDSRYEILSRDNTVKFSNILYIIDEFADLIYNDMAKENKSRNELKNLIVKIAQKSRGANIHLVIATQRPSVDVVCGIIKSNFPARIACRVSSALDSRIVLDRPGAESLNGKGDALLVFSDVELRFKVAISD